MDRLQKCVEVNTLGSGDDDLAIDDSARRQRLAQGLDQLREVACE